MREQFLEQEFHCIVCTTKIPPEKLKFKATTCSDECARLRKLALRARQDMRECRFCRKPMTMADKAAFQRFRKWEQLYPNLAYPAQYKRYGDMGPEDHDGFAAHDAVFTLAIAQRMAQEDEDAAERTKAASVSAQAAVEVVREAVPEV